MSDRTDPSRGPAVVALGGGHGLSVTLAALSTLTPSVTGIAGVVDDGGSSGRLRQRLSIPPPGDLRMAIAALMPEDPSADLWRRVLQHRFMGSADIGGHAVGNLVLAALWEETGDVVAGLDVLAQAMRVRGRVLPHAREPVELVAHVDGPVEGEEIRGQAAISASRRPVIELRLEPPDPLPCRDAEAAVRTADVVVLGPGSWYTSVLPHLLIPGMAAALRESTARRILVLNLSAEPGETTGFAADSYLRTWHRLFPDVGLDVVVADSSHVEDRARLDDAAATVGAVVLYRRVSDDGVHDLHALARAFEDAFGDVGDPPA